MFTLFRCHVSILVLFFFKPKANEAQVTVSGGEDFAREQGDSVTMKCTIQVSGSATYDVVANPFVWNKRQGYNEVSSLANLLVLSSPFKEENRFTVKYETSIMEYTLDISNLRVEDNGEYICEIDPDIYVNYKLSVVEKDWLKINIYSSQQASIYWGDLQPVDLITVDDGTPGSVYCVVTATVRYVSISILIDDEEVVYDSFYYLNRTCTLSGDEGLRKQSCTVSLGSSNFTAENVRNFKCVAQVHSSQPGTEKAALIYIRGTPFVTEECQSEVTVTMGKPYIIKCLFKSVPQPSSVLWKDQEMKDLTKTENYATEMEVKEGDDIEARLSISQVRKQDFQIYTLLAVIDGQETVLTQIELKNEGSNNGCGRNAQYDQHLLMVTVGLAAIFTGIDFL